MTLIFMDVRHNRMVTPIPFKPNYLNFVYLSASF